jgi:opacity protein-like surface antigen
MTRRILILVSVVMLLGAGKASAQESVGAGRVEIGAALFGFGATFLPQADPSQPRLDSYVLSGALTRNLNHRYGVEGDFGFVFGTRDVPASTTTAAPVDAKTPNVLMYSANLVFNPIRSDRRIVPYVDAGVGAWSVFGGSQIGNFGLAPDATYLTGSVGGGVRWFIINHWGVRADYRYILIDQGSHTTALQPGHVSAHRLYGALVMTF